MKTFNHERLSLARKRRKLTLRRLGELSGLAPATLTRLEKGDREPEATSVQRLADVLGYPEGFFLLRICPNSIVIVSASGALHV